ncbi:CPS_HP_G0031670.mRNA.1.CDS.1 [Saccharomyces cerevisiae]|nr:CPS_HP_G0031670.mRNA.1.CDS.1 [Saccharomyces cerevisiae]CAI6540901.1 CPS_HP_G0031670.mRNA.1.CDS.1 [Saccharomyces cerevisiae]CAI7379130.1 CPS_collapsed_G0032210.mRNA.1.CDS.1 [Saccharomyces cerevisiae]
MSQYRFVRVPREVEKAIPVVNAPRPRAVVPPPNSETARLVREYAAKELTAPVLNHSLRVFQYSVAIIRDQFPAWDLDQEVLYVTCLLHDIATTDKNMRATKMSFVSIMDYADAVTEAIIRHQDLTGTGYITTLGLILQVATTLDNVGSNTDLIHIDTVRAINEQFPRLHWLSCFATVVDTENSRKPWGHTSSLGDDFSKKVICNTFGYN